ncbi:hypothetical protein D3C86_1457690 [compost metagenome]
MLADIQLIPGNPFGGLVTYMGFLSHDRADFRDVLQLGRVIENAHTPRPTQPQVAAEVLIRHTPTDRSLQVPVVITGHLALAHTKLRKPQIIVDKALLIVADTAGSQSESHPDFLG